MAFFTPKLPISGISGPLGSIDRTIKAGTGLAVKFVRRSGKWSLEQKTAATTTNSPSKQEQSDKYFKCDCKWKKLSPTCRLEIQKRQMEIGSKYEKTLPVYHYFMRYCLYGTECDKYLFYNCLETAASYTEYETYLDVIGWNVNGICNLKSRLILNGQVHEEKISGNDGHVQFIVSKEDLQSGTNDIYVQICFKLSNKLEYYIPPPIINGSFETGDLTGWGHSKWNTSRIYTQYGITGEKAQHGNYSYHSHIWSSWGTGRGYTNITQTIDLTNINKISYWICTLPIGNKRYWIHRFFVGYTNLLNDLYADYPDWTLLEFDVSEFTGNQTIKIYAELVKSSSPSGSFDTWIDNVKAD